MNEADREILQEIAKIAGNGLTKTQDPDVIKVLSRARNSAHNLVSWYDTT